VPVLRIDLTRALVKVAKRKNLPLVLWNERFHDAVIPWSFNKASRSAERLRGGSIVLLHDRQNSKRIELFCGILASYIDRLKNRGLTFGKLPASAELWPRGANRPSAVGTLTDGGLSGHSTS
jgi:hypothetical protein